MFLLLLLNGILKQTHGAFKGQQDMSISMIATNGAFKGELRTPR